MPVKVSIIIATYNSAATLEKVLDAIRKQTYVHEAIEVILVDGGSTDKTLEIAKRYECSVVKNPKTEPATAKRLGWIQARGKYIAYVDADEVLSPDSISRKVELLERNPNVRMVMSSGYLSPKDGSFVNHYINEYGDPFSYFIYGLSRSDGQYMYEMKQAYAVNDETDEYVIFDFSKSKKLPLLELAVFGTLLDLEYIKKEFSVSTMEQLGTEFLPHIFYYMVERTPYLGMLKHDPINHYSVPNLSAYLNKLRWRIKNNVYFMSSMGATAYLRRDELIGKPSRIKSYLFMPYAFSLILPTIDALRMFFRLREPAILAHIPLTLFTASQILFHMILRTFGYRPKLRSYDEKKVVE